MTFKTAISNFRFTVFK